MPTLDVARGMISALTTDLQRDGRLGLPRRYLVGDHDLPYIPRGSKHEFKALAEKSITNWLPLVSDTYADSLHVEGYRADRSADNSAAWDWWQANGLDARQSIPVRGALEYGASYVVVLRSVGSAPAIKCHDPLRSYALYEEDDAEFPDYYLYRVGTSALGDTLYDLYDDTNVYHYRMPKDSGADLVLDSTEPHGMPVCPVVRFRDRLDGRARGIITPLKVLQDRVNDVAFVLSIALQYASFRQRWATGLSIPEAEILDPDSGEVIGYEPIEPFEAAVNRLWTSESPDTKFGDFAQTETSGHLQAYWAAIRSLSALAQISPNVLTGDLVNLSADALAQLEAVTQRKISSYELIFGESWEQVFQLAAIAAGAEIDETAQVRWRDTEARSLESVAKALSILAKDLGVPVEGLWEKIPNATDQDIALWKSLAARPDGMAVLAESLRRNVDALEEPAPGAFAPADPPPAAPAA